MSENFYGDIKRMPDKLLTEKLTESKKAVTDYTAEEQRRKNFTSAERLADRLHHLLHEVRATDCDYYYSDWGVGQLTTCRQEFKQMAARLEDYVRTINDNTEKIIDQMLTILEKR